MLGFSFVLCLHDLRSEESRGTRVLAVHRMGSEGAHIFSRPWSFWYTVLYTGLMTVFGIQAMKRWGLDQEDKFQIWRYVSLIGFQWIFFFLIP